MSVEIEIEGSEGVVARLRSLANRILGAGDAAEGLSEEMMKFMVTDAKVNCPVKTGRLRDSIHYEGSYPNYTLIADATDAKGLPYAQWIEYGTSRMAAQPFLWPAVNQGVATYGPQIKREVISFIMM